MLVHIAWTSTFLRRANNVVYFPEVSRFFESVGIVQRPSKEVERSERSYKLKNCKNATQRAKLSGSSPVCVTVHSRALIYEMLGVCASRTTLRSMLQ